MENLDKAIAILSDRLTEFALPEEMEDAVRTAKELEVLREAKWIIKGVLGDA